MTILFFLILLLVVMLMKFIRDNSRALSNRYKETEREYNNLLQENLALRRESDVLRRELEQTTALYEISKEICRPLDENKIFELFKEQISRHVAINDLKFIKEETDLPAYKDYMIMPLQVYQNTAGYLAVKGIKEEEKERYNILAQQFLLGIRRAILYERVQDLTITDSLTGILNRRHWHERFIQEIDRSIKFKLKFSFFMVDIDHFKDINDKYGHLVGDAVLKEISRRLKDNTRQIDLVCRYGGEEFCVILIETDKAQALVVAERIRRACEEKYIKVYDENFRVTVSIGVSNFPDDFDAKDSLIDKADTALYNAKQAGRNRVCIFSAS